MNQQAARARIEKLKKEINRHRYLYHVLDKQEISDSALDALKKELEKLENQFPDLITPDSPTQRVSGKPLAKFKKITHGQPMLSLQDAFSFSELIEWEKRISKLTNQKIDYFAEYKIDGLAISLKYKKGVLIQGATRGDGKIGEDVTQNLKTIDSIPLKLEKPIDCEIRGEIYISKNEFKAHKAKYSNPRNLAAGSIRQLNPKITRSRNLSFMAWQLLGADKQSDEHRELEKLGFKSVPGRYCADLEEVDKYFKNINRKKLDYEIDGTVIGINDNKLLSQLGIAGKSPRGLIAYKFPGQEAATIIKNINVQIGRTGALTPVAYLKPINLQGAIISRASLHNKDEIERLDVRIGDTVIVQRAGDVIPKVIKVLKNLRPQNSKKYKIPKIAPSVKQRAIQRRQIIHFVSRPAFNIEGLGPKIIDQLIKQNLISNPADIFTLKEGDLIPLERFAEKSAKNIISSIRSSKKISLARFIYALGIYQAGEETAIDLANSFGNINNLQKANAEELENIPDIGPIVAESIYNWFRKNDKYLKKLLNYIKIKNPKIKKQKNIIFVLTGELESMTREQAKQRIRDWGGQISNSISSNTNYLITGKNPGSKYNKAKRFGIKILDERKFIQKISQAG